ncbi:Cilia- and flagella-associated protein 99 [Lamellibrachia satsuma]|nr:Cilia- and flagella-associated protein 99 [Lamellibrachia satsuma]
MHSHTDTEAVQEYMLSHTDTKAVQEYMLSHTDTKEVQEYMLSHTDTKEVQEYMLSHTDTKEVQENMLSHTDTKEVQEYMLSHTDTKEVQEYMLSHTDPKEVQEYMLSHTDTKAVQEYMLSHTDTKEVQEYMLSHTDTKEVQEYMLSHTDTKEVQEYMLNHTDTKDVQEYMLSHTDTKEVQEYMLSHTDTKAVQEYMLSHTDTKEVQEYMLSHTDTKAVQEYMLSHTDTKEVQEYMLSHTDTKAVQEYMLSHTDTKEVQEYMLSHTDTKAVQEYMLSHTDTKEVQEYMHSHTDTKAVQEYKHSHADTKAVQEYMHSHADTKAVQEYMHSHADTKAVQEYMHSNTDTKAVQEYLHNHADTKAVQEYMHCHADSKALQDYGGLVHCCVEVIQSFDPSTEAPEDHVNQYLKHLDAAESEQTFIMEVFSGCTRYSRVLRVVLDGFYNRDGKTILRSEQTLYLVFTYLALFRLDELGLDAFRKLVQSQDTNKMYRFLNFFLDDKNLRTWMKDAWNKQYDASFVQTDLLAPILRWHPELMRLVAQLKSKVDNKSAKKKSKTTTTASEPFNLTKPRPRGIPMPDIIPTLKKHRPVPQTTYHEPREQIEMSAIQEMNRRQAEEQLMEASRSQFACANPEKSSKTKQRLAKIITEEEEKLQFNKSKAMPAPPRKISDNTPVKLNTVTILREGRLYKKREEAELKKLEGYEAGAKDKTEFLEWQRKMKAKDMAEQLAEIEKRRLSGKMSYEEAILSREKIAEENRQKVAEMKEQAVKHMQYYMEQKLQEEQQQRRLVEGVMSTHKNAKEAKKRMKEYKGKIVQDVTEELKDLMKQALEEAEVEMKQRMHIIHEIRALESTRALRHGKLVDLSSTGGHKLLGEMSIVELRERLALFQDEQKEKEERKRDDIIEAKQVKHQMLVNTIELISRHRTEQNRAATIKMETLKSCHLKKPEIEDEKVADLQRRLEEKRAERLHQQEKSRHSINKKSLQRLRQLSTSKKMSEENRWQELEESRERTARVCTQDSSKSSKATNRHVALAMY